MESKRVKKKDPAVTILRVCCALQVYFIHYFAGHGLREYMWVFDLAVPSFLLVSAYLYGLRRTDETVLGFRFLKKRFISLASSLYPFLLVVFTIFAILYPDQIRQLIISLFANLLFACDLYKPLPHCGHLWFIQTLAMCYLSMMLCSRIPVFRKIFTNPLLILLSGTVVILCGFVYRGGYLVSIFFYMLLYYNANKIRSVTLKWHFSIFLVLLGTSYLLSSLKYQDTFHYGIYLLYIQNYTFAIVNIMLFEKLFQQIGEHLWLDFLGNLSMEFYLVHHFFAFDYSIFLGLSITLIFAIVLYYIATQNKVWLSSLLRLNK